MSKTNGPSLLRLVVGVTMAVSSLWVLCFSGSHLQTTVHVQFLDQTNIHKSTLPRVTTLLLKKQWATLLLIKQRRNLYFCYGLGLKIIGLISVTAKSFTISIIVIWRMIELSTTMQIMSSCITEASAGICPTFLRLLVLRSRGGFGCIWNHQPTPKGYQVWKTCSISLSATDMMLIFLYGCAWPPGRSLMRILWFPKRTNWCVGL